MKKTTIRPLLAAALMLFLSSTAFAAGLYPEYEGANTNDVAATERVNIVWDNTDDEYMIDTLVDIIQFAAISENSKVWLYTTAGDKPAIEVVPTEECVNTLIADYSKASIQMKEGNIVQTALDDLQNDATVTERSLMTLGAEFTKGMVDGNKNVIFSQFSSRGFGTSSSFSNSPNVKNTFSNGDFVQTALKLSGYEQCDAYYDNKAGIVTIDKGVADDNMLIVAEAAKSEYLYISGYMQSEAGYYRDTDKDKATGVSLSYNHINIEKKTEPRNMAMALFTIDSTVADVALDSFVIPVKNADYVTVYYCADKGKGVCTPTTVYDKTQDEKIVNLKAPSPTPSSKTGSLLDDAFDDAFDKTVTTSGKGTVGNTIGNVFSGFWSVVAFILGLLFRILLFAIVVLIILLVVNKKFRNNLHIKILASKYGPQFEKLTAKGGEAAKTVNGLFNNTVKKAKGNAEFNEKFIFISHSSKDFSMPNNRIERVVCALEEKGVKCWMSETGIKPGQNYADVLSEAIRKCAMMIVFISPSSAASVDVGNEMSMATEYRKTVIPVQIADFDLFKEFPRWDYHLRQKQKNKPIQQ